VKSSPLSLHLLFFRYQLSFYLSDFRDDRSEDSTERPPSHSEITCKCFFEDEIRVIRVRPECTLRDLKKKIKSEFGSRLNVKWKDSDGDEIAIRKDRHWKSAMAAGFHHGAIKLILSEKEKQLISSTETSVLESLVDGVIIIDAKGSSSLFLLCPLSSLTPLLLQVHFTL
jgi:hypothetical protein